MTMTEQDFRSILSKGVLDLLEREFHHKGDIFATEEEMEAIRRESLEWSDLLGGLDAKRLLGYIFEAQHDFRRAQWEAEEAAAAENMYVCDSCAREIEVGGISDDEGYLALTGVTGRLHVPCPLCAAPVSTHQVRHEPREVK